MELQLSGSNRRSLYGRFPSISVNNSNKVIEIHTRVGSMYYQVGTLANHRIEWSGNDPVYCGKGDYPKIAMNDNNQVVLVYEGNFRQIYYHVGVLNGDQIDWGETKYPLHNGRYPTVALRSDGKVIIGFENALVGWSTNYIIGDVSTDSNDKVIKNRSEPATMFLHSVNEFSLAINENCNCIVAVGRTWWFKLIFKVGVFQDDNNAQPVAWGEGHTFDSFKGYCPAIGIDHNGQIVSVQQSVLGRHLTYRVGQVQFDNKKIQWSDDPAKHYDLGCNATVAVKNDGTVIEEHETNFSMLGLIGNRLFYRVGKICSPEQASESDE